MKNFKDSLFDEFRMVRPWYWPEGGQPHRTESFTWIIKKKIATTWWSDTSLIKRYKEEKIKVVINCCEFDNRNNIQNDFKYYHINTRDFGTPTDSQLEKFLDITSKYGVSGDPIVVHYVASCGRTGIMIVTWAAFNGYIPEELDPVKWIQKLRPCCLETKEQMELPRKLAKKYRKQV